MNYEDIRDALNEFLTQADEEISSINYQIEGLLLEIDPAAIHFSETFMKQIALRWNLEFDSPMLQRASFYSSGYPEVFTRAVDAYLRLEEEAVTSLTSNLLPRFMERETQHRRTDFIYFVIKCRESIRLLSLYSHDKLIKFVGDVTFMAMCLKKCSNDDHSTFVTLSIARTLTYLWYSGAFDNEGGFDSFLETANVKVMNFRNKFNDSESLDIFYWQSFIDKHREQNQ